MAGVALVTGAGSGIGQAIAIALARSGHRVVLVGRRRGALEETAAAIVAVGGSVDVWPADASQPPDVDALISSVTVEVGRLDVLVHAAGLHALSPIDQLPVEEFDALYGSNLRAPFLLTRAALPLLRQGGGDIVFVNSTVIFGQRAGVGPYAATKQGLLALADSIRQEVKTQGIRVLTVFPGRTATPNQEEIHRQEGRDYRPEELLQPEELATIVLAALTLPRTAEVTELRIGPMRPVAPRGAW